MYSKTLLDEYLKAKNLTQYKQAAAELGFSTAYIAKINTGKEEFTEETAAYIAIECGMDVQEVLIRLAEARAKTPTVKNVWANMAKKYSAGLQGALGAALLTVAHPATSDFISSLMHHYVKKLSKGTI